MRTYLGTLIALGLSLEVSSLAAAPQQPIPLIFDTDIGNDVDDVLALGMTHALQSRGECELLAVTVTKDHELAAAFTDIPAAQKLAAEWPTPIVWSGYEIGQALAYPHQSIERDYAYVAHHPLAEAYVLYQPPPHDRPTWDLTSVLYGVRSDRGYFELSKRGRVRIANDGLTTLEESADGRDRYLIVSDAYRPRALEALQLLSSQPPTVGR